MKVVLFTRIFHTVSFNLVNSANSDGITGKHAATHVWMHYIQMQWVL